MRIENEGVIVGPADGKDLANPIGGGDGRQDPRRGHRRRLLCPRQCPPARLCGAPYPPSPRGGLLRTGGRAERAGGPAHDGGPGGLFEVVPWGVVHQPSNPGTHPTRVLLVFSPAGLERLFEKAVEGHMPLQVMPSDPAVLERLEAFTEKYGYKFAEFPAGS